jgi:hypothetical protein
MSVLIYIDTSKQVGTSGCSPIRIVAETWFEENDPEGVAFEYEVT